MTRNVEHCSDVELLEALYGVRAPGAHLEGCEECSRRWQALMDRRAEARAEADVPAAFLAAQQARIRARMEGSREAAFGLPAAPVAVAALLVLIAVILLRPSPQREPAYARGGGDTQFYLDIYQQMAAEEPRGAAPIRGLFEEKRR